LPVNYTDDLYETLQLQDQLQTKYTGGTVLHVFLGEQLGDIEAVKSLVRKIAANYRLPYFTLTPTFSICPSHGYLRGEQPRCAHCNQETEIYSRVVERRQTGNMPYLRPVKQWNDGKLQAEYCPAQEHFVGRLSRQGRLRGLCHRVQHEFRTTCVRPFIAAPVVTRIAAAIQGAGQYTLQTFRSTTVLNPGFFKTGDPGFSPGEMRQLRELAAPFVQKCIVR
jgi:hypothetical protein